MDVFPKWIIEDNSLIIGKVSFHRQLAQNVNNVKGGGWFEYDSETNAFILYGRSEDFGMVSKETVHDAVSRGYIGRYLKDKRYKDHKIYFSSSGRLEDALNNLEELIPYEVEETEDVFEPKPSGADEQAITGEYTRYSRGVVKDWGNIQKYKPIINENKIGRNEPCICGSGKKYKKCCLK